MIQFNRLATAAVMFLISAPVFAQDYPPLVAEAIDNVIERGEGSGRFAFTRETHEGEDSFTARYEPAASDEGGAWTLVSPAEPDAVAEALEDAFEQMVEEGQSADLGVVLGGMQEAPEDRGDGVPEEVGLAALIGEDIHLVDEDDANATFEFTPPNKGELEGFAKNLTGELIIDKAQALPLRLRYFSPQPFRAVAIAHVESADVSILFGEVSPGGPIAVTGMVTRLSGSALFRKFDQDSRVVHSDFMEISPLTQ